MSFQTSVAVANAMLDAIETAIGPTAILKIRTGQPPASCAAADTGTVLATMSLPTDWMAAASGRVKALAGTWSDASADASGTAGHFRIYASDGTTCGMQGTVVVTGGVGDLSLSSLSINATQAVTITGFTVTAQNA